MKERRARQSTGEWAALIDQLKSSVMGVNEFFRRQYLAPATFRRWQSRCASQRKARSTSASTGFVVVKPVEKSLPAQSGSSIQLQIGPSITLAIRHDL
jgi:hypothetical protein